MSISNVDTHTHTHTWQLMSVIRRFTCVFVFVFLFQTADVFVLLWARRLDLMGLKS